MIAELLRRHDGVITLDQACAAGLDSDAVKRRLRSGRWRRCSRGVYFVDDRPFTDAARVRAGVWGYGPAAVASGLTAAWWHGLSTTPPPVVEATVPRKANGRAHPGTSIRRRDLDPADVVEVRGLRVTTIALTAVETPVKVLDRALGRHVELPELWRAHLRNKGRYGSPRARIYLQGAKTGARSAGERLLVKLLTNERITGWTANSPVGPYRVDVLFRELKIAIEVDGYAFHSDVDDFVRDRARQNYLVMNGWQVLRFTWWDLTERPERVIAEIRRVIAA